jgi:glycosyltransferase involved in cell wall biosynthesis
VKSSAFSAAAPLRRLCDSPGERERLGAAAAEKAEEFTLDAVGDDLVALYEELAG